MKILQEVPCGRRGERPRTVRRVHGRGETTHRTKRRRTTIGEWRQHGGFIGRVRQLQKWFLSSGATRSRWLCITTSSFLSPFKATDTVSHLCSHCGRVWASNGSPTSLMSGFHDSTRVGYSGVRNSRGKQDSRRRSGRGRSHRRWRDG